MFKINNENLNLEFKKPLNIENEKDLEKIKLLLNHEGAFKFIRYASRVFNQCAHAEKTKDYKSYQEACRMGIDLKEYTPGKILDFWGYHLDWYLRDVAKLMK